MPNERYPNDVGAGWVKTDDKGEKYISFRIDVEAIRSLGGDGIDTADVLCYRIKSEHPKAPDYQLKFYPKGGNRARATRPPVANESRRRPAPFEEEDEDAIPF